mmetsp:Transcript_95388/g.269708  ORF Transcript_95388/g.269708 Transcript_95388/m.269708 type:complete len:254 (-) Transcript_95388:1065-1826(-)
MPTFAPFSPGRRSRPCKQLAKCLRRCKATNSAPSAPRRPETTPAKAALHTRPVASKTSTLAFSTEREEVPLQLPTEHSVAKSDMMLTPDAQSFPLSWSASSKRTGAPGVKGTTQMTLVPRISSPCEWASASSLPLLATSLRWTKTSSKSPSSSSAPRETPAAGGSGNSGHDRIKPKPFALLNHRTRPCVSNASGFTRASIFPSVSSGKKAPGVEGSSITNFFVDTWKYTFSALLYSHWPPMWPHQSLPEASGK